MHEKTPTPICIGVGVEVMTTILSTTMFNPVGLAVQILHRKVRPDWDRKFTLQSAK